MKTKQSKHKQFTQATVLPSTEPMANWLSSLPAAQGHRPRRAACDRSCMTVENCAASRDNWLTVNFLDSATYTFPAGGNANSGSSYTSHYVPLLSEPSELDFGSVPSTGAKAPDCLDVSACSSGRSCRAVLSCTHLSHQVVPLFNQRPGFVESAQAWCKALPRVKKGNENLQGCAE